MKAHKIDNLIKACKGGHSEVAMQLLERGANPEERTAKGKTALMYTGRGHDVALAEQLIRRGANVNTRTIKGKTPLHYAASGTPPL